MYSHIDGSMRNSDTACGCSGFSKHLKTEFHEPFNLYVLLIKMASKYKIIIECHEYESQNIGFC